MPLPTWLRTPPRPSRSVRPLLEALEDRRLPAAFTVTTVADGGPGSLRQAILDSNANPGQTNTVNFNVAGTGVHTIAPLSALPAVTNPAVIDGTTQPGFAGAPLIDLNGANIGSGAGLEITAGASTVRGLAINGFRGPGVLIDGGVGTVIDQDYIGTDAAGSRAVPNFVGVSVAGSGRNVIARSVISGNGGDGVGLGQSSGDQVLYDLIGTNAAGTAELHNVGNGVKVESNAAGNLVAGDVISGNQGAGVLLNGSLNVVQGCAIGLIGSGPLGNREGVDVEGGFGNTVGGPAAGDANVISGNADAGVLLNGPQNVVAGNRIGTDGSGTAALGNATQGVEITAAGNAVLVNVLSGNGSTGVLIGGARARNNLVAGNKIGTNAAGSAALPNQHAGVFIYFDAAGNTVGGAAAAYSNLISGNTNGIGVDLEISTLNNLVAGNRIGTNAAGTAALANGVGLQIGRTADRNTVGGTAAGAGNLISGNTTGVVIGGATNLIQGNRIGTNAAGTAAVPNLSWGISLQSLDGDDGGSNTVGGAAAGAGNLISGNAGYGVQVLEARNNLIQGNLIGTAADGATALPNGDDGVFITSNNSLNAANNSVAGNVIAFNKGDGVLVGSDATYVFPAGTGNRVTQNSIFSNTQVGIDLGPDDGVTPNDSAGHTGPNDFQDFPVITSAVGGGAFGDGITSVDFSLTMTANVQYTVEFFVSPSPDPSGFGQGKTFVGSATVSSSTSGTFPERANLTGNFAGQFLTATATDANGNTSEFSNALQVSPGP
jgi:hypothetical protein